jgi:hypothetical protein
MNYKEYLESRDWKEKRKLKLLKGKGCGICGSCKVDIHHLNYKNLTDVDMTDLRRLCRRCHFLAHDLFKQGKITFRSTNHHSRFAIIKNAVKKELGIYHKNMFKT